VRDSAQRVDLDLLPLTDAEHLLRSLIGGRAEADPAATRKLAIHCARLPLALCAAAELAATRPSAPLAWLVRQLGRRHQRLDLLSSGGDPRTAVRAVFSWSYQHLDHDSARAFRLLGLYPGTGIEPYAGAALMGTTEAHARRLLMALARAHLIKPADPARYAMHGLLRIYAAELAVACDRIEDISDLAGHGGTTVTETVHRHEIRPALTTGAAAMDKILTTKRTPARPPTGEPATPGMAP